MFPSITPERLDIGRGEITVSDQGSAPVKFTIDKLLEYESPEVISTVFPVEVRMFPSPQVMRGRIFVDSRLPALKKESVR